MRSTESQARRRKKSATQHLTNEVILIDSLHQSICLCIFFLFVCVCVYHEMHSHQQCWLDHMVFVRMMKCIVRGCLTKHCYYVGGHGDCIQSNNNEKSYNTYLGPGGGEEVHVWFDCLTKSQRGRKRRGHVWLITGCINSRWDIKIWLFKASSSLKLWPLIWVVH